MRRKWLDRYLVGLAAILLLFACAMQVWVATRLPLWGDELDHIQTVFRAWRGHHNFWWHLGQFNANPPGDNLALRAYYHSGFLRWLLSYSPELYWRLPYVLAYCLTAAAAFLGAWRWTGSTIVGFLMFLYTLASSELFIYATESRFYVTLVLFMTVCVWLFQTAVERPGSRELVALAVMAAIGTVHHLMMAAVGYLVFAYTIYWFAVRTWFTRGRGMASNLALLAVGALPFAVYKIELKHFLFIPAPWSDAAPISALLEKGLKNAILGPIAHVQPIDFGDGAALYIVAVGLACSLALSIRAYRIERVIQGLFLAAMLFGTPLALYVSAESRHYGLLGRHFLYQVPIVSCTLVYFWKIATEQFGQKMRVFVSFFSPRSLKVAAAVAAIGAAYMTAHVASRISSRAYFLRDRSPAKVTYPLIEWQMFYRHVPAARKLVVVGSQPDVLNGLTDLGGFKAGQMTTYTKEFSPLFYSVKGGFELDGKEHKTLRLQVESHPEQFDYLVFDDAERLKALLPKLPWARWHCAIYENGQPLRFCRI